MSRIARALNNPSFLSYSHLLIDDEYERVLPLSEFRATRRAFVPSQLSQLDAKKLGENLRNATRRKLAILVSPDTVLRELYVASKVTITTRYLFLSKTRSNKKNTKKKMEKIDSSNRIVPSSRRPSSTGKIRMDFDEEANDESSSAR